MFGPGGEGHCSMPTPAELTVVIDGGGGEIEIPTGHGVSRLAGMCRVVEIHGEDGRLRNRARRSTK